MPIRAQQQKVDSTKNANHFLTRPENNGAKQGEDIINVYSNFLTHAFVIFFDVYYFNKPHGKC